MTNPVDRHSIDRYLNTEMARLNIPGMAVGIVHGDQIVHIQGYGKADSTGRPITPQTPFYIGSLSKSFTALAVMQLVEANKIDLDAPVQKYIPYFELADKEASAKITIRNLLNQTTGISEKNGNCLWIRPEDLAEVIRGLNRMPLSHVVGTKYEYSNVNYSIAGHVVEAVSGQPFSDYVSRHIFEALGLRHSYTSRERALMDGLAEGNYYRCGRLFAGVGPYQPGLLPAGMFIASVEDMAHYLIVHLNGGRLGDSSILSPQGIQALHTPGLPMKGNKFHYAMGWAVGSMDGRKVVQHNGDTGYFHATAMLFPEKAWGVVLLANASGFEQIMQVDGITRNVAKMLYGDPAPEPVTLPLVMRAIYWGVLFMPLLLIAGIGYGLVFWYNGADLVAWKTVVTAVLYWVIAVFFWFKLPGLIPFSISSMRVFYPELAYAIASGSAMGFIGGILYPLLGLLARKL